MLVVAASIIAVLVFASSEMLNLLTRVFDLCETQRSGGAFEEVTEGGELGQVTLLSG